MSSTGAAWPQTVGQDWSILPLCGRKKNTIFFLLEWHALVRYAGRHIAFREEDKMGVLNHIDSLLSDAEWQCRSSNLADWNDEEGSSSTCFDDNGDKFGVDRTEGTVPCNPGHSYVVNAVLGFPSLGEDVAEFALSDHTSPEGHAVPVERRRRVKRREK